MWVTEVVGSEKREMWKSTYAIVVMVQVATVKINKLVD